MAPITLAPFLSLSSPSSRLLIRSLVSTLPKSFSQKLSMYSFRSQSKGAIKAYLTQGTSHPIARALLTPSLFGTAHFAAHCSPSLVARAFISTKSSYQTKDKAAAEIGVRFRPQGLSRKEVTTEFGAQVDVAKANRALRVLHERRLNGTLAYASQLPKIPGSSGSLISKYLAWLRKHHPVNEEAASKRFIEEEKLRIETELLGKAKELNLNAPQSKVGETANIYGESIIEGIRKKNEKEFESIIPENRPADWNKNFPPLPCKGPLTPREIGFIRDYALNERREALERQAQEERDRISTENWKEHWRRRATLSDLKEPPKMSLWQLLWPSALFALTVIGVAVLFARSYTPPARSTRLWPDIPPAIATVATIIGANVLVCVLWRFGPAQRLLNKFFVSVSGMPVPLSMLGNTFSHQTPRHLLTNIIMLAIMGPRLHDDIGRGNFLAVYFATGVFASVVSISGYALRGIFSSSMGASGAVLGVLGCWCVYNSDKKFRFFFLPDSMMPPLSSTFIICWWVAVEIIATRMPWLGVDTYAHLGGLFAGIVAALILKEYKRPGDHRAILD
ncbi:MAG: hypothetical protein M1829_005783 [Trizodia sp. TS-e1964]|nr:MAG: hypothetical protein M1829_005783 [Trizodia sp. TS-e1964]